MPGTVSDLYIDPDQRGSMPTGEPAAPPPPPAPTPVVAVQPVSTKARMADEGPDGKIRDTSTEAMRPGNDLQYREFDADPKDTPTAEPTKQAEAAPAPVVEQPKLYAGKFKTVDELDNSYQEAQKLITRQGQELAELKKSKVAEAAAPPPAPVKTPAQIATDEERKNKFLTDFVADPEKVMSDLQQRSIQQTKAALEAQQLTNDWRKTNTDIAEHEFFVTAEAYRLSQSDPELAANPTALLSKATENFRQVAGKLRSEGAREALTSETRVIPLLQTTAPTTATEQPSEKAPLTADAAYDAHMRMLKDQERRSHQGLRR